MKKILLIICLFFISINVFASDYVTSILVDGVKYESFDPEKLEYEIKVPSNKDKINIVFIFDKTSYKGHGPNNEIDLKVGLNEIKYTIQDSDFNDLATYKVNVIRDDTRSDDNKLASLTVAGKKVELKEDVTKYSVEVNNELKNAEIKAVLNNLAASFVSGYGERTGQNAINLTSKITEVEVKVMSERENIRSYIIDIIKSDYKNNDATLKELKVNEFDLKFNSNIYEYYVDVPHDMEEVNINALVNDSKASVKYEKNNKINDGLNKIVVSVTAEDKTVKDYIINVTRQKLEYLVKSIEIENYNIEFNNNTSTYYIDTKETKDTKLNIKVLLNDNNVIVKETGNNSLEDGSVVKISAILDDIEEVYNIIIKNVEIESVSKEIKVDGSISSDKQMLISLVVFGIGTFSLLFAILHRRSVSLKSKKV